MNKQILLNKLDTKCCYPILLFFIVFVCKCLIVENSFWLVHLSVSASIHWPLWLWWKCRNRLLLSLSVNSNEMLCLRQDLPGSHSLADKDDVFYWILLWSDDFIFYFLVILKALVPVTAWDWVLDKTKCRMQKLYQFQIILGCTAVPEMATK